MCVMSLQLEWGEVLGRERCLIVAASLWGLGFADDPFETTQRPPGVKPRPVAELSTAQGTG